MFQRIMVPMDGSELAQGVLPHATLLAKTYGAELVLVSAIDPGTADAGQEHHANLSQIAERAEAEAQRYLGTVAEGLSKQGVTVKEEVIMGRPAEAIATYAEKSGVDLIAISTHGRSGPARWLFGSVTDRVLHLTSVPMLIIRPGEHPAVGATVNTLIVPVDGSSLAEASLAYARDLAKRLRLRVIVAQAVSLPVMATGEGPVVMSTDLLNEMEQSAETYVTAVAEQFKADGVTAEARVLQGPAAAVLVDLAKAEPNAIVILSTHGRSGVGRAVMGSVADRLVRSSGDAVLVIRPKGV